MSELIHIIYASAATEALNDATVQNILEISRKNNQKNDISGILLLHDGNFFQVLEGLENKVIPVIERIKKDARHDKIVEIIKEPIPKRAFKNWSMGFANVSNAELIAIEGINDFYKEQICLRDIDAGRAKKLLQAFSQGFWQ